MRKEKERLLEEAFDQREAEKAERTKLFLEKLQQVGLKKEFAEKLHHCKTENFCSNFKSLLAEYEAKVEFKIEI